MIVFKDWSLHVCKSSYWQQWSEVFNNGRHCYRSLTFQICVVVVSCMQFSHRSIGHVINAPEFSTEIRKGYYQLARWAQPSGSGNDITDVCRNAFSILLSPHDELIFYITMCGLHFWEVVLTMYRTRPRKFSMLERLNKVSTMLGHRVPAGMYRKIMITCIQRGLHVAAHSHSRARDGLEL